MGVAAKLTDMFSPLIILVGAALGVGTLWFATKLGMTGERSFFPVVLISIASFYIVFAFETADPGTILLNIGFAALFVLAASWGYRHGLILCAAGLGGHAVFDMVYHATSHSPAPDWWASVCLSFDAIYAIWLVALLRRQGTDTAV
ncbi:hypothetical protein [Palleronia caenipelagi]|uniref:Uncharacterized protein n=1 Tax=Palleronia caenipelagi TaxID=2489174 RepID=A0A547PMN1_9RHOB|nr:hypothetical protein [Palleronia caenipelagi]TRD15401.1 hypothetical protein FEV53_16595 [Palleronia caenipelagi]